jgi:hypothetical protein
LLANVCSNMCVPLQHAEALLPWAAGVTREHLPRWHEALSSNPSAAQKQKSSFTALKLPCVPSTPPICWAHCPFYCLQVCLF